MGTVNWEAYSHEELYRMLWEDADVADVSMVAIEWARHRAALDTHAEVLREQRVALLDSWQGAAAEEAAARLATLAARVAKISALAGAGQQAAQDAADALAMARAMMPPPPTGPFTGGTDGLASWSPAAPGMVGVPGVPPPGAPLPAETSPPPALPPPLGEAPTFGMASLPSPPELPAFAPPPTFSPQSFAPQSFATMPSFAPPPVPSGGSGFSFYFGAVGSDQQKAQAVRAMQTYESSLAGSGRLIDEARGAVPPAAQATRAVGAPPASAATTGVPWSRLLSGGAPNSAIGAGPVGSAPGPAGQSPPLGSGPRVGGQPGPAATPGMAAVPRTPEVAARGVPHGGVAPPVSGRRDDDETHENLLPTIDHGLFTVELPTSPPVIGGVPGGQP